jgi:hypothetical protein
MKKFLVVRHSRVGQWQFDTAREVGVFMWGKEGADYSIFIRADDLPHDVFELQTDLDDMSKECSKNP